MEHARQRGLAWQAAARAGLVAALLAAWGPARSQTVGSAHATFGAGTTPCAKYVEAYENNEDGPAVRMAGSWVQGYLSAWNRQLQYNAEPPLKSFDPEVIALFVYRYCQENPRKNVAAATLGLIDDLSKAK